MKTRRFTILLFMTLLSGWLRFKGTSFGMPGLYRPDEEYMVYPALGFGESWNPRFSLYPAAQMYLQHAALVVYAAWQGHWSDFRVLYDSEIHAFAFLVARWASAALGTVTVPATYLAAAPILGIPAAFASAAIVAFSTFGILNSKFATADVAAALWLTVAIAMVLRIAVYRRTWYYVGAGIFAGLATATKYPSGAIVFAIAVAHIGARRRAGLSFPGSFVDPRIYLAAVLTFVAFFCATPYVFLDWRQTVSDYTFQRNFVVSGYSAAGYGWHWLLARSMKDGFGIALEVFMLIALPWALLSRRPGALALLTFVGATFAALVTSHLLFYRYILTPFPGLVFLAGILAADLMNFAVARLGDQRGKMLAGIGLAILLAPSLFRDLQLDRLLSRTDTRIMARQWIRAHIPRGNEIAEIDNTTPYGKPVLVGEYPVVRFESPAELQSNNIHWVLSDSYPPLFYSPGPNDAELGELDSQATLVFDANPLRGGNPAPVYDPNDAFYAPLRHFSNVTRPGPRIRIWQLK
jgi:dolichyl-phosphate-mannose-protein mannosyltransferase